MNEVKQELGELAIYFTALFGSIFLWGWVCFCFYNWFVLPVFDIPQITYLQATGFRLFIGLFNIKKPTNEKIGSAKAFGWALMMPLITLFIGWIISFVVL